MNLDTLTEKIVAFLTKEVAPKVSNPMTKFAIGAACSATGKQMIAAKVAPLVNAISDKDGTFSAEVVKDFLISGIKMSGKMPILGNLVTLDESDIVKFCEGL